MPEFRQNLATKEWVILTPERGRKPSDFRAPDAPKASSASDCSLCKLGKGVVQSREPALVGKAPQVSDGGAFRRLPGEGIHEIILDSKAHDKHPALLDKKGMNDLLRVYRERFNATRENDRVSLAILFKNHSARAAGGLDHPHSQLVGSSVVPAHVRSRMDEAQKYFDQHSACVFCRMVEEERKQGARILADTENFCAFVLFAAVSPFHIWIVPKRHTPSFGDATDKELENLAGVLQGILKKFNKGLNNPDYNYLIQSTPLDRGTTDAFHWYISLIARLAPLSGFELGSGMHVNEVLPEESAKFLNSIKV